MKDKSIQLLLGFFLTLAGLFTGLLNSIEEPFNVGENYAMICILLFNSAWFIPYSIVYIRNKNKDKLKVAFLTYAFFVLPFIYYRNHTVSFNPEKWKAELDFNRLYDHYPAHKNGNMVADIINSKLLLVINFIAI